MVSAGFGHTVLLRSDGCAVVPSSKAGMLHCPDELHPMATTLPSLRRSTVVWRLPAAGYGHRSKWMWTMQHSIAGARRKVGVTFWACWRAEFHGGEHPGTKVGDTTRDRDLVFQLQLLCEEDTVALMGSTVGGEERCRLIAQGNDSAWETHKRIARELNPGFVEGNFHLFSQQLIHHSGNPFDLGYVLLFLDFFLQIQGMWIFKISTLFCQMHSCWPKSAVQIQEPQLLKWLNWLKRLKWLHAVQSDGESVPEHRMERNRICIDAHIYIYTYIYNI